jgi:MFS family permease
MVADLRSPTTTPEYHETGGEDYDKFPGRRKFIMVVTVSFLGFLAPVASISVLAAVPEVAETYGTTGDVINISNALYLVSMDIGPVFWGPMGQVYGRRVVRCSIALDRIALLSPLALL